MGKKTYNNTMNKKEYTSAIKKTPFEYLPSKKIGTLISKGMLYEEAFQKCFVENELEVVSEERRKEIFNVVYDRLSGLDSYLLDEFLHGSISSSKFILVYAIASTDNLFFEFLLSQYREALIGSKNYISISDFDDFFASIKEKNPVVAKWSERTIKQLSGGYRNILVESGLGYREKKLIYAQKAVINPPVVEHIEKINKAFIQAVLGA